MPADYSETHRASGVVVLRATQKVSLGWDSSDEKVARPKPGGVFGACVTRALAASGR